MYQLVLIRHGESTWNLENRFTGWTDVPLTDTGIAQAKAAGHLLREEGFDFDIAYTSVLKRATHTLWHCLDSMDRTWLPVVNSWRSFKRQELTTGNHVRSMLSKQCHNVCVARFKTLV